MAPTPPVIARPGVATQAKNATQRPGLVDRESTQNRRGPAEMAKVRSTARLNTRLTDQRLHAALKKVAEIQDQQHVKDIYASIPKMAPSLRRHEKPANEVPDDDNALEEALPVEMLETQQVDPMDEDLSVDEEDAPPVASKKRLAPDYYDYWNFGSDEHIATELPKKKKKGDGLRDVVVALRKNTPSENLELKMNLVTKVPPIPAPKGKGKRPRSLCVQFYVIQIAC